MERSKSEALSVKFNQLIPGGHTNFRGNMEVAKHRLFSDRSEGSHIWDIDGNEYIEFTGALGPTVIGHRHPEYVAALVDLLQKQNPLMGSGSLCCPDDVIAAEKIVKHVPCAESMKFNLSGSDAVQMTLRLARAYTGRKYMVRFLGNYHGWVDNILGGKVRANPDEKPFPFYDPNATPDQDAYYTQGRSEGAYMDTFLLPYNDFEALERTVEKYHEEIAIIHLEGVVCNHFCLYPKPGYLEKIRELCTKYEILMSMDEVITGFRFGLGGAQEYLGVTPDMCTMGKAIAGGLPVSVTAGKTDIFTPLKERKVLGPGTFNGYPLGMRAVVATLSILEKNDGEVYKTMAKVQQRLMDGMKEIAARRGITYSIAWGPGVLFNLFGVEHEGRFYFDDDLKGLNGDLQLKFWHGMHEKGIMLLPSGGRMYLNIAHNDADIDKTLQAADEVLATF